MTRKLLFLAGTLGLLATPLAHADGLGMTGKIGTLGLGVELSVGSELLRGRVGVNWFEYDFDDTYADVDYDIDFQLQSASALLDLHPLGGGFRLTGGVLLNNNELAATAAPALVYDIGGTLYPIADVGNLIGDITFDDYAGYVGLGWANSIGGDGGLGVSVDIGVALQGTPDVTLMADGLLASDPTFLADLAVEEEALQDDLDEFEYYPVVAVGVYYRF